MICSRSSIFKAVTASSIGLVLIFCSLYVDIAPMAAHTRAFEMPRTLNVSTAFAQRAASKRPPAENGHRNQIGANAAFLPLQVASRYNLSILALLAARLPRQATAAFQWAGLSSPDRAPPRIS